ncbi:MAG: type I-E CRISPR-associated protein Cse2/CasB [Desulfobulbus sp.]|jgi:CRISPR system Cascade subunit CasB
MTQPLEKKDKTERFVAYTMQRCQQDSALASALRRADNPNTAYQSWYYLTAFVDLEQPAQRIPYATIAAAIARAKATQNGPVTIGRAIARCYEDGSRNDQARTKLRRLLACNQTEEACRILRPLLSLIDSRAGVRLNYARLLKDLLFFNNDAQQIKARWAKDFYGDFSQEDTP